MIEQPGIPRQIPLPFAAAERIAFDIFWPGENRELLEQLQKLATGESACNIYLWGPSGAGKSHLLHAACNLASATNRRSAYVPLGQRGDLLPELLEGLDQLDLVGIDDLDQICGDAAWEMAVFHLFNRMREHGCPLIIAARASPKGTALELADLSSRLAWDLVYHLEPLDERARFQALRHRANLRGMDIPNDVLEFLSRRIGRDTRTLFDWLDKLDAASLAAKRKLTVPFVRDLVEVGRRGP